MVSVTSRKGCTACFHRTAFSSSTRGEGHGWRLKPPRRLGSTSVVAEIMARGKSPMHRRSVDAGYVVRLVSVLPGICCNAPAPLLLPLVCHRKTGSAISCGAYRYPRDGCCIGGPRTNCLSTPFTHEKANKGLLPPCGIPGEPSSGLWAFRGSEREKQSEIDRRR
ncbi:hypothetical protein BC628DRAFT_208892 [Trametes gibbosa]|nr:hypothetical protein BC628DRAFT_208892 [Trametes gibbosa]